MISGLNLASKSPFLDPREPQSVTTHYTDVPAQEVRRRIEDVLIGLLRTLASGQAPRLMICRPSVNARAETESGMMGMESIDAVESVYALGSKRGLPTLARVVKLLDLIYGILNTGERMTKREVFYLHKDLFGTQVCSDSTLSLISALLKVPRNCLNIVSNTKGLVSGSLYYEEEGVGTTVGHRLMRIPEVLDVIDRFEVDAEFILVVEKEAVARKLVGEDFCARTRCLVVTGCGYPDHQTRFFLKRLTNEHSHLPIFIFTDADPHGFEILTVYTFGSIALAGESDHTALLSAHWLGLHVSDVIEGGRGGMPLSLNERKKLDRLLDLPQLTEGAQGDRFRAWRRELEQMMVENTKFEIESLYMEDESRLVRYLMDKVEGRFCL